MIIADADIYLLEWGFEISSITPLIHLWHGKEDRNISWKYSQQLAEVMPQVTTHWLENDGTTHCQSLTPSAS